jgi:putative transposase
MEGKGAWRDNVFVERLWRNVKYEEVYLRAHDSVSKSVSALRGVACASATPGQHRAGVGGRWIE